MNILSARGIFQNKNDSAGVRRNDLRLSLRALGVDKLDFVGTGEHFNAGVDIRDRDGRRLDSGDIVPLLKAFEETNIFMNECRFGVTDGCAERMRAGQNEVHTQFTLVTKPQPSGTILRNVLLAAATGASDVLSSSAELGEKNILRVRVLIRNNFEDILRHIRTELGLANVIDESSQWEKENLKPFIIAEQMPVVSK